MEDIDIPNPNNFGSGTGGPVSMLNNHVLTKSDFMTGAFPAQYGNALSGVFDLRLRQGNATKREFVTQMGLNGFEFGMEGGMGKAGASYLLAYQNTIAEHKTGIRYAINKKLSATDLVWAGMTYTRLQFSYIDSVRSVNQTNQFARLHQAGVPLSCGKSLPSGNIVFPKN